VFFHFFMPADFPAAGTGVVMKVFGEGNGANVNTAHFTATLSIIRPGAGNWKTTALSVSTPATSASITDSGDGYFAAGNTSAFNGYDIGAADFCGGTGGSCANQEAILKVQRISGSGGDTGGAFDIVSIYLFYAN
jgi:hypothetical protein